MKNRTLCSALLAFALVGCTMNGKKMFEFGGSSTSSSPSPSPSSSGGAPVASQDGAAVNEPAATHGVPSELHAQEKEVQLAYLSAQDDTKQRTGNEHETAASLRNTAEKCRVAARQLAHAGVKYVTVIGETVVQTDKIETEICARVEKLAVTWDQDVLAATQAELDEIAKPFKAAKITGDRLAFILEHQRRDTFYGIGGVKLETPNQLKTARVIFRITEYNDFFRYYRTEFAGDKIHSDTKREYRLDPGVDGFR